MTALGRPRPDEHLLGRARRMVEMGERPLERYVREEWETAFGHTRVVLDALRKVSPIELDTIERLEIPHEQFAEAIRHAEALYEILDRMLPEFWGALVHGILAGVPDKSGILEAQEESLRKQLGEPYSKGEGPLCLAQSPFAGEDTRCYLDLDHAGDHQWEHSAPES